MSCKGLHVVLAAWLWCAAAACAEDPFPLQTGDNLFSTNVWNYLLGGALECERAISRMDVVTNGSDVVTNWSAPGGLDAVQYVFTSRVDTGLYISALITQSWSSSYATNIGTTNAPIYTNVVVTNTIILTNWTIGYATNAVTNVLGRAVTYDLLYEIDQALLTMATNFIDYRGASAGTGLDDVMATRTGTNWAWVSNRWIQIDMGMDYDHYTYRDAPPTWTISNAFQYLGIGTALVYTVVDTNPVVEAIDGWRLGEYSTRTVVRTNAATTNTWTRYRFLSQPGTNLAPVLMGQLYCVVTQAATLAASGFGNSADGTYHWASADGDGFGTWTHEDPSNVSVIVQTDHSLFKLRTNGAADTYTLYDTSWHSEDVAFSFLYSGVGRGRWLDASNHAAGSTTVSNGWLGWDWDKRYQFYWRNSGGYPYALPFERLAPTNVTPAIVGLALQDTNFSGALNIPVTVTGKVYVAGETFGSDIFGLSHIETGLVYQLSQPTGHLGVAIYDIDALQVTGWGDYWAGGTNTSLLGSTISIWYTNDAPQFGTPRRLTKEALNERWKLRNLYRTTWRQATMAKGVLYTISQTTNESAANTVCTTPGLGPVRQTNGVNVGSLVSYSWDWKCDWTDRTDVPGGTSKSHAMNAGEQARWFETTTYVSNLPAGLTAVATWYEALNPVTQFKAVEENHSSSNRWDAVYVHTTSFTSRFDRCLYDAVCVGCSYAITCPTSISLAVVSQPLSGISPSAFTYRRTGSPRAKDAEALAVNLPVTPAGPTTALRGSGTQSAVGDSCSTTGSCGKAVSFVNVVSYSQARWGYSYDPHFVTLDWNFQFVTGAPP